MKTQKNDRLQAKERGLRRNKPCQHFDLGYPELWEDKFLLLKSPSLFVLWYGSPRKGIYCDIKKLPWISKCPWEWHQAHLRNSAMKDFFPSTCALGSMDKIAAINMSKFNYMCITMEKSAKYSVEWRRLSCSSIIYTVLCLVAQSCLTLRPHGL